MKLTCELVPSTCFYTNVRSNVSKEDWDKIRKKSYTLAQNRCEICGDTGYNQGYKWPVECHETWEYDDEKKTQTLKGLISLCPYCHKVKHPGLAGMKGETHIVYDQLCKVNRITEEEAKRYIEECFAVWHERSEHKWELDLSYLENYMKDDI
jgi:hypothetical protein